MVSNSIYFASALSFGPLTWLFGILEPAVAGYALRLYRILGARVAWWVFATFSLLALGHAFHSSGAAAKVVSSSVSFDLVTVLIPFLLLIGMVHTENTMVAQTRVGRKEREVRVRKESEAQQMESQAQQKMAGLIQETEELRSRVARFAEREKALTDSAQQYYLLFTNNPQPMWVFDLRSLQVLAVNDAAQAQYGFSLKEFMGKTARELVPAQEMETFLADMDRPANDGQSRGVWRQCRKDGSTFEAEVRAMDLKHSDRPARLILASENTNPQRSDSALQREEKMELISRVVATVARHIESLPGDISVETDRLLSKQVDAEMGESLKRISAAAIRATAVTRQLLTVGAQGSIKTQALDFNRFLTRLEPSIRRITGSSISFEKHYGADRLFIMADSRLLEHIVVNLVLNARDAMPTGGALSFRTSTVRFNGNSGRSDREGAFVRLAVRDSGCGMSPEVRGQLFEPFFATRQTGESRGLGLASSYGATKQLGGWIDVASAVGAGTEVSIYFPSCPVPAMAVEAKDSASASKTILLVEPDPRMRTMARTALEWNGYRVVETDSASVAITVWPKQAANVDLLVTEYALPGAMSGCQLAEWLRRAKPDLKVLYSYDAGKRPDGLEQLKGEDLITKPFTSVDLLECISRSLPEMS
jgi:two-component system cell cycle sensor histidine kinase/response regulator CckA